MKKFTLLFAFLLSYVGIAMAQTTPISAVSDLSNSKVYFITAKDAGRGALYTDLTNNALGCIGGTYGNYPNNTAGGNTKDYSALNQQFAIMQNNGQYFLYSLAAEKFAYDDGKYVFFSEYPTQVITVEASDVTGYFYIKFRGVDMLNFSGGHDPNYGTVANWNTADDGNRLQIAAVDSKTLEESVVNAILGKCSIAKGNLYVKIQAAQAVYNGLEDNSTAAATALQSAIGNANTVLANATATDEVLNAQVTALRTAINVANGMVKRADYGNDKAFYLRNVASGRYMTVVTASTNDGVKIKDYAGDDTQRFFLISTNVSGQYQLRNVAGQYLAAVSPWYTKSQDAAYTFTIEAAENEGEFYIKCPIGYVAQNSGQTADGQIIYSNHRADNVSRAWYLEEADATASQILSASIATAEQYRGYFGTGLGQYNDESNTVDGNYWTAKAAEIGSATDEAKTEAANDLYSALATTFTKIADGTLPINQPETGKFYRFKSSTGSNRMLCTASTTGGHTTQLGMGDANGSLRSSIFMLKESGSNKRLVAYGTGLCVGKFAYGQNSDTGNWLSYQEETGGTVSDKIGNFTFSAGSALGTYHIASTSGRYIYNGGGTYVDAANSTPNTGYDWVIEEVRYLPVYFSDLGVATLWSPVALNVADGGNVRVKAYTGENTSASLKLTEITTGVIPAETAVVLEKAEGAAMGTDEPECTYLPVTTAAETASSDLRGQATTIDAVVGAYTLQNRTVGENTVIGMYQYNGSTLAGFKAYLVDESGSAEGFAFVFGGVTSIEKVTPAAIENNRIYDLSGRRVLNARKGLYIVNGKKLIIK